MFNCFKGKFTNREIQSFCSVFSGLVYCTFTTHIHKSLIMNGAGEWNRALDSRVNTSLKEQPVVRRIRDPNPGTSQAFSTGPNSADIGWSPTPAVSLRLCPFLGRIASGFSSFPGVFSRSCAPAIVGLIVIKRQRLWFRCLW